MKVFLTMTDTQERGEHESRGNHGTDKGLSINSCSSFCCTHCGSTSVQFLHPWNEQPRGENKQEGFHAAIVLRQSLRAVNMV